MNVVVRQTSAMAIVSLVAGILGWTLIPFLGSICASSPATWRGRKSAAIRRGWTATAWPSAA